MKVLNIALVTNNYWPYSGGVVSSIDSFARELSIQGHRVFIITFDFNGQECAPSIDGVTVIRLPVLARFIYKKNYFVVPWRYHAAVLQVFKLINPDIVHSQHPCLLGASALKAARALNLPIVFTHHTQYEHYAHYVPMPQWLTRRVIKKMVQAYCQRVDCVIAPSESVKKSIQLYMPNKCVVIPSGLLPDFYPDDSIVKNKSQVFTLLCVSRFAKEKSIDLLLDMFKMLCDQNNLIASGVKLRFKLIGYGSELNYLKNYAYNILTLSDQEVFFIEHMPKKIIAREYREADVFVFSSTTETQGIVLAEAMAAATPVVALHGPGQQDIIEHGVNGYLVDDVNQMVQVIMRFIINQNSLVSMQGAALKTAKKYMPDQVTRDLLDLYNSVLKRIE
jgi:1,2-diacylglycerol 3-alpha-glucosyltransferase